MAVIMFPQKPPPQSTSAGPWGPPVTRSGHWEYEDVGISVINYGFPAGNHGSKSAASVFDDSDGNVESKWREILVNARSYRFAEQQGFTTFVHFPYSTYPPIVGTNSNTFVREMLALGKITMFELGGSHPGPFKPDATEIRFKYYANPDQPTKKPSYVP